MLVPLNQVTPSTPSTPLQELDHTLTPIEHHTPPIHMPHLPILSTYCPPTPQEPTLISPTIPPPPPLSSTQP
ncbi:hypothetical protein V2J09_021562 [Rumex salicifolius]